MMGKDVERILSYIHTLENNIAVVISSLTEVIALPIVTTSSPEEDEAEGPEDKRDEIPHPTDSSALVNPAFMIISEMDRDLGRMNKLQSSLYTSPDTFNNSIGSPWTELFAMRESVDEAYVYASNFPQLEYVGVKAGLMAKLQIALSRTIDAKWAIITYHDYIQRGYDCMFNGNIASITFDSGIDEKSTGNISQSYTENVNVPKKTNDPF